MPDDHLNPSSSSEPQEMVCVYDPLHELMARFENVKATATTGDPFAGLTPEDRLKKHIVDGVKKHLDQHITDALETYPPLSIINDILLDGMKTVGELFGSGKMQLPFVLQSAEVMKAAVKLLEPLMEKVEGDEKGSILLATVAGDVHDIGKNLVDIILSNNGYRVVNIGIKQPINNILDQAEAQKCQVIGLSGLLVKSTLIMRDNLLEMNARGLSRYPVILGGAALTRSYVEVDLSALYEGRVFYAQDAFEGLRLMGDLCERTVATPNEARTDRLEIGDSGISEAQQGGAIEAGESAPDSEEDEVYERVRSHRTDVLDPELYTYTGVHSGIEPQQSPPPLPFYGAKRHTKFDIFEIYKYINPIALFRGQWQFRRPDGMTNPDFAKWLEDTTAPIFERMKRELATVLKPRVKWGYFPCASEGNDLILYEQNGDTELVRFNFPRQRDQRRLCIADFFLPTTADTRDTVGFQIVTVGEDVSIRERELFANGEFQDYLFVHGMGVETAEALAEYWHRQVRVEMGIADEEPSDMRLLFSARYHGSRYSFGYPACPNLEDQAKLFEILRPTDIGIELTEEFMLSPEQSTSAIIVHHPGAKYFNVR